MPFRLLCIQPAQFDGCSGVALALVGEEVVEGVGSGDEAQVRGRGALDEGDELGGVAEGGD